METNRYMTGRGVIAFGFVLALSAAYVPADNSELIRKGLRRPTDSRPAVDVSGSSDLDGAASLLSDESGRSENGQPDDVIDLSDLPAVPPDQEVVEAVTRALEFFARKQNADGSWKDTKSAIAHTGLVVLSYLSYGVTHEQEGPYRENMSKALDWLIAQVGPNGELNDGGRRYEQAIGVYALAEAYMATGDERLKGPLQRAANLLAEAQLSDGGWRYDSGYTRGDLSVTGWVIAGLVSAKNAGIELPDALFDKVGKYVLECHGDGGKFGYTPGRKSLSMTAVGMFCLQLLGREVIGPIVAGSGLNAEGGGGQENENETYKRLVESAMIELMQNQNGPDKWKVYYWYYGTFAMRIFGGDFWAEWRENIHHTLIPKQVRDGSDNDGSWNAELSGSTRGHTGRTVTTTWVVLTLMSPYRPPVHPEPTDPLGPGEVPVTDPDLPSFTSDEATTENIFRRADSLKQGNEDPFIQDGNDGKKDMGDDPFMIDPANGDTGDLIDKGRLDDPFTPELGSGKNGVAVKSADDPFLPERGNGSGSKLSAVDDPFMLELGNQ